MVNGILEIVFLGNKLINYLTCAGMIILSLIIIKIFRWVILKKLEVWAKKTVTTFDDFLVDIIKKIAVPFLYLLALYVSINVLTLAPYVERVLSNLAVVVTTLFAVVVIQRMINYGFKIYCNKVSAAKALEKSLNGVLKVVKFVVWSVAVIFLLDNLGFKITTVIAGLGIGGVAIALAAQAVLGDLFSYFSIIVDRPFEIGDFIIVGDLRGTIEHVGIKTTRVRSLGGEQLIFPNSDLTSSRLRNYKRMQKRRIIFKLGVVYNTPLAKLKEIPKMMEESIKEVASTIFDRAHFASYGDFSLTFEIVYYVLSSDYNKYMDIQQEINFKIKEEFEKKNIEFAFPTQTLYLNKQSSV